MSSIEADEATSMTTVHTIHDEGAIWAQQAWDQAPKELRLRLTKVCPAATRNLVCDGQAHT